MSNGNKADTALLPDVQYAETPYETWRKPYPAWFGIADTDKLLDSVVSDLDCGYSHQLGKVISVFGMW